MLTSRRPRVRVVDRLVGKLGFAMAFAPWTRAVLVQVFRWLAAHRKRSSHAELWPEVHLELLKAMFLIPQMQCCLSQEWSTRVEAADASPGGHGRAWTEMPLDLVKNLARLSDHKGAYTNLALPWGIETTGEEVCPLQRHHWPIAKNPP